MKPKNPYTLQCRKKIQMKWASAMAVILAVMRTLAKIMGCDQGEKFQWWLVDCLKYRKNFFSSWLQQLSGSFWAWFSIFHTFIAKLLAFCALSASFDTVSPLIFLIFFFVFDSFDVFFEAYQSLLWYLFDILI